MDTETILIVLLLLLIVGTALYSMKVDDISEGEVKGYVNSSTGAHVYSVNVSDSTSIKGGA